MAFEAADGVTVAAAVTAAAPLGELRHRGVPTVARVAEPAPVVLIPAHGLPHGRPAARAAATAGVAPQVPQARVPARLLARGKPQQAAQKQQPQRTEAQPQLGAGRAANNDK